MLHWFDSGKYVAFVAGAYGVSAGVLAALAVESLWRARKWRKAAERGRSAKSSVTKALSAGDLAAGDMAAEALAAKTPAEVKMDAGAP